MNGRTPTLAQQTQTAPSPAVLPGVGRVGVWAGMGLSSMTYKRTGEYRLFVLARALDPDGSGHIRTEALKEAALSYGVKPRTFAVWLAGALECGIFEGLYPVTRKVCGRTVTNFEVLRIRSQVTAFQIFGGKPDKTKSEISIKQLFSTNWRARIFAAYIKANHDGDIISLPTLEDLTGIPARTLKKDGLGKLVTAKRQIAITPHHAGAAEFLNENASRGKYFKFIDPANGNEPRTAVHKPSRRSVSNNVARTAAPGRRLAILASLAHDEKTSLYPTAIISSQAENVVIKRHYYFTPDVQGLTTKEAAKKKARHERKIIKLSQLMTRLPQDPRAIYVQRGRRNVWDEIPLLDTHIIFSRDNAEKMSLL